MNLRRIAILFVKELHASASNFLIVFALVVPVVFSLLVSLVFGDLFSGRPRLGFYDPENSRFTKMMIAQSHLKSSLYDSEDRMQADVEQGIIEYGYLVPAGFDQALQIGTPVDFTVYTWGEMPFKDRLIADTTLINTISKIAGLESNVSVEIRQLGQADLTSLADRMLPLIILMTIMLGGVMAPAISMIEEKQKRTISALNVTPARLSEVFAAKALLGIGLCLSSSLATLALNSAFGSDPLLLVFVLLLGALAASLLGTLLGALVKDMNVLLATLKAGGLLLIAPGIIDLIPKAPQWIARLFPTYYILNPVMDVAERGASFSDILGNLLVLLAMVGVMVFVLALVIERQQKKLALL